MTNNTVKVSRISSRPSSNISNTTPILVTQCNTSGLRNKTRVGKDGAKMVTKMRKRIILKVRNQQKVGATGSGRELLVLGVRGHGANNLHIITRERGIGDEHRKGSLKINGKNGG